MTKITDPMNAEAAAQKLLQGRMDYVRQAIDARQALDAAQDALREAERADTSAYQAAVKNGGWSEDELKKIGLTKPEKLKRVQQKRQAKPEPATGEGQDKQAPVQDATTNENSQDTGQTEYLQADA